MRTRISSYFITFFFIGEVKNNITQHWVADHSIHPLESGESVMCTLWATANQRLSVHSGLYFRFTSSQKLEYLVFTLIVHVGCQLSFWLENLYFVSEVLFWNKFFFQYFYSSKIFKPYFFFYLSINWGVTFYFYLSTQYQYFAQHCFFVYSDNLLAHRTFKPLRRKVSSLGDTFNIRLQIETLKKNWKFSSLSFTLEHLSSIVRWSNLLDSGGIERKLHM